MNFYNVTVVSLTDTDRQTDRQKQTYITHEDEVAVEKIDHLIKSLLSTVINGTLMCCPLMLCQKFIL